MASWPIYGAKRIGAVSGPVALFTAVLAWRLYHELMDGRMWTAMALLLAGGIVLVLDQGRNGDAQLLGLLAVLLATAA